jgi:putative transposase
MIDRAHDLPITKQAEALKISRGSVYYLPRPISATDLQMQPIKMPGPMDVD